MNFPEQIGKRCLQSEIGHNMSVNIICFSPRQVKGKAAVQHCEEIDACIAAAFEVEYETLGDIGREFALPCGKEL